MQLSMSLPPNQWWGAVSRDSLIIISHSFLFVNYFFKVFLIFFWLFFECFLSHFRPFLHTILRLRICSVASIATTNTIKTPTMSNKKLNHSCSGKIVIIASWRGSKYQLSLPGNATWWKVSNSEEKSTTAQAPTVTNKAPIPVSPQISGVALVELKSTTPNLCSI